MSILSNPENRIGRTDLVRVRIIFLLAISAVLFSSCSLFRSVTDAPEQKEILLARDCGLDKMKCCDSDPPCSYNQKCCTDPNDSLRNYCSDECGCGAEGEFCCKDGALRLDGATGIVVQTAQNALPAFASQTILAFITITARLAFLAA